MLVELLFLFSSFNYIFFNYLLAPPSVNGRSNLIVKNAGREDGGQYTCIAKNPAGERESHSTVVVKGMTVK